MRNEDGIFAVWVALSCALLLACTAIAVDLGYAYVQAQRTQNAADAAALGGTIYLPDAPGLAKERAYDLARHNGFDPADPNVTVTADQVRDAPTRLTVKISKQIPVFFAGILGIHHMVVTKSASADYDQPVQMGSPIPAFGNQPECRSSCSQPDLWANVEGPQSFKHNGNAFMAGYCAANSADNCAGEGFNNSDLEPSGSIFVIRNQSVGASLRIDLFDAPFVNVGDLCPATGPYTAPARSLGKLAADVGAIDPIAARRYLPGPWPTSEYCTGDTLIPTPASRQPVATQFRVLQPDQTPWTTADNQPEPSCPLLTFTGANDPVSAYADGSTAAAWRKWLTLCTVSNARAGDYLLQVRTLAGAGNNQFSIRVGAPSAAVFAQGRMAIYANSGGKNNSAFDIARVLPGAAGRTLTLDIFDAGDAFDGSSGTLRVVPPGEATSAGQPLAQFGGCSYTPPPGNANGPPWGHPSATGRDCSVSGVSIRDYNGQWVQWQVPIPADYMCDYSNPRGCWVRVNFGFDQGVRDVTSWRAQLDGNPVRLVN